MTGQARVLTQEEVIQVARHLDKKTRVLFFIGCYTGLRIGEILALRRLQLYDEKNIPRYWLVVKRLKKRANLFSRIPVHEALRQTLYRFSDALGEDYLFDSPRKEGAISRIAAHNKLRKAFNAAGLYDAKTHSMRRTCMTLLKRAKVPLSDIQAISGHSNLSRLAVYLQSDDDDLVEGIGKLNFG